MVSRGKASNKLKVQTRLKRKVRQLLHKQEEEATFWQLVYVMSLIATTALGN